MAYVAIGVVALGMLLHATPWGLGLGGDSYYYVSGAQNLASGQGFARQTEEGEVRPITHYPPLYSAVLAGLILLGGQAVAGARWLHAVLFGANAVLLGRLVGLRGKTPALGILASLIFLTSPAMLSVHAWLLSEALFLLLTLLFFDRLGVVCERARRSDLVLSACLASLACLTRYTGIALVGTGTLTLLLISERGRKPRLRDSLVFTAVSLALPVAWLARNIARIGTPTNRAFSVHLPDVTQLLAGVDALTLWFLPGDIPLVWRGILAGAVCVWVVVSAVHVSRRERGARQVDAVGRMLLLFVVVYVGTVIGSLMFFDASVPLDDRILAPLFLAITALASWAVEATLAAPDRRRWVKVLVGGAIAALLIVNGSRQVRRTELFRLWGGGYASPDWQHSGLIRWVADLPMEAPLYTNELNAVYLLTGRQARQAPVQWDPVRGVERPDYETELDGMRLRLTADGGALVLFTGLIGDVPTRWSGEDLTEGLRVMYSEFDGVAYVAGE